MPSISPVECPVLPGQSAHQHYVEAMIGTRTRKHIYDVQYDLLFVFHLLS